MSVYIRKCSGKKGYVYRLIFDSTDAKGIRKRSTKTLPQGTSKAQAEKIANQMELDIEFGEYVEHEKTTLKNHCENTCFTKYINTIGTEQIQDYCNIQKEKYHRSNMVQVKGGYILKDCKTENSEREFPIGNTLATIIRQQQKINYKRMCDAGEEYAGGDFLLTMTNILMET